MPGEYGNRAMSEDAASDAAEETPSSASTQAADDAGLLIEVEGDPPADRAAQLQAALAEAQKDKKETWDKFVRAAADLENYRRRAKRDMDDAKADARTRVLKEMLPVMDNLERALAHTGVAAGGAGVAPGGAGVAAGGAGPAAAEGDLTSILEGVKLVLRQFSHALEKCEVTAVEAEGKPFDPNLHEAIGQQESDAPAGTVISVLQRGYRLSDRLLRPALVLVARGKPEPAADGAA